MVKRIQPFAADNESERKSSDTCDARTTKEESPLTDSRLSGFAIVTRASLRPRESCDRSNTSHRAISCCGYVESLHTFRTRLPSTTGGLFTLGQLILFSTDTGDAWLLDVTDQLAVRPASRRRPLNPSIWKRPIPASLSDGRGAITSRDPLSSTPIVTPVGSPQSSAILRRRSLVRVSSEMSNIFS